MKENKECNIIRDLLPSYVDNLTSNETNEFIRKHLENCEQCKKVLQNIKTTENKEENTKSKRYIDVAKKYNIKMKVLILVIIVILLVIFSVTILRNVIIIKSLSNKAKQSIDYDNFHIIWSSYNSKGSAIFDIYYKDGKYIEKMSNFYYDDDTREKTSNQVISYYDGNGKKADYFVNQKVVAYTKVDAGSFFEHPTIMPQNMSHIMLFEENYMSFIQLCLMYPIFSEKCNNNDCYILKYITSGNKSISYIDKETGLITRTKGVTGYTDGDLDTYSDVVYEFNNVTDKDISMPSTEGYTEQK